MTTVLDIIEGAARLIGVVRKGEALDADEAEDGLVSLNDMISSWSNNSLMIYARVWESFSVAAAASYTIGSGQTLNTTKPIAIKAAFIRSGSIDYPMTKITDEQYESIGYKSLSTPFPEFFDYDNGHPYGTIRLYPQLSVASTLFLLTEKALSSFAALTTTVDLPAGANKLLRYNLALEMHPEYFGADTPVPATVIKGAADSLRSFSTAIAKNRPIKFMPEPLASESNIYSGIA